MRFRFADLVRATVQETFAWWTDLEEADAGRIMPPLRERRIVHRTEGEIETDDRWSVFCVPLRTRAVLRPRPPDGWEVVSRFRGGWVRDTVRLEAVTGATRVAMDMELALRRPWSWAARFLRGPLERLFRDDLRAVNRRLEEALAAVGDGTPGRPLTREPGRGC